VFTDDEVYAPTAEVENRVEKTGSDARIKTARAQFREQSRENDEVLNNIDVALIKITNNNPALFVAYYRHYVKYEFTSDYGEHERGLALTNNGNTDMRSSLLHLNPGKSLTSDSTGVSLFGSTLIHEYSHTSQGGAHPSLIDLSGEAKAYGI
jgi:hypothetical protein